MLREIWRPTRPGEEIVATTVYRDKLLIATTRGLIEWDAGEEIFQHLNFCCYRSPVSGKEMIHAYYSARPWGL